MKMLVRDYSAAGRKLVGGEEEPDFSNIDVSDFGNVCGCCGAYAVGSVYQLAEREDQRHNQGIMIGLNLPIATLPDDGATRYVHIELPEGNVLTVRERIAPGRGY